MWCSKSGNIFRSRCHRYHNEPMDIYIRAHVSLNVFVLIFQYFSLIYLKLHRYRRNGILPMLKRNLSVKTAPQRWQENAADGTFDVVLTFEEKVFDMVLEG